jgi:nucleotide-binding universal stress UspA family protein
MLSRDLGDGGRTAEHKYPVIVGVDGSFAAIRAARWASAIAERFEAPLEIVHAVADRTAADSAVRRESTEAILQSAHQAVHVQFKGLQIAVRQLVGPADQTLIAASHAFRLIVLGTDELSSNTADFSGWATATVAAYSVCPVVAWRGDVISPTQQPIAWAWESSLFTPGPPADRWAMSHLRPGCSGAKSKAMHDNIFRTHCCRGSIYARTSTSRRLSNPTGPARRFYDLHRTRNYL